jgi:type VI protein secretion system component VasK
MSSEERQSRRQQRRLTRRQRAEQDARRQRRRRIFLAGIGLALLVAFALTLFSQIRNGDDFPEVQAAAEPHADLPQERTILGDPDAPVHLIEWSDYQ